MALVIPHSQVDRMVRDLKNVPNGARRASANAINEVLMVGKKAAPKEIRKLYTVKKARAISQSLTIKRAVAKAREIQGKLTSKGRPLSLDKFSYTRQTKKGVSVRVRRDQGKKLIPSAFFGKNTRSRWTDPGPRSGGQTMFRDAGGVWIRKRYRNLRIWNMDKPHSGGARRAYLNSFRMSETGTRVPRLPIEQLFGPSAPAMFENKTVMSRVEKLVGAELERAVNYRIGRLLAGFRK